MNALTDQCDSLTVADIMSGQVLTVTRSDSMVDAASLLTNPEVAVAVVNDQGRCVGLLTAGSFVRRTARKSTPHDSSDLPPPEDRARRESEGYRIVAEAVDAVGTYMSRVLHSVTPSTPVLRAAEKMRSHNLLSLPILDESGCPIGMLTSLDILSFLLAADATVDKSQGAGEPLANQADTKDREPCRS